MEGGSTNADSDHSMTWEDFFGSTSDLTPTLIGIYDSLLEPSKKNTPEISRFDINAKDTRNDPPLNKIEEHSDITMVKTNNADLKEVAVTSKIPGGIKLPGLGNKSTLHNLRTKTHSEVNSVADNDVCNSNLTTSEPSFLNRTLNRTIKTEIRLTESNAYDNLSPNVKRMISSATETSSALKFQKKMTGARASVRGHRSHIPLVGATSKITQSGVEILPSVEIYDQPTGIMATKAKGEDKKHLTKESPTKQQKIAKPEFKIEPQETYDVPTNNKPVLFELNTDSKTTIEALSLPFIDQSIDMNASIQDREFDTKISPNKKSPEKVPPKIPVAIKEKSNSLTRNELSPAKSTKPEGLGSIGNLKLSSEKESSKSSTLTIEVTRPLSMSSIASSSSTSSSGVQNKGVNSAYLASIESLDDNSDADMISANGSNNFVNSAGLKEPVTLEGRGDNMWRAHYEEMSGLSQLERVCAEIVYTENVYVRDLQQVVEGYLHVWRKHNIFSDEELDELFNNIEDIYNFNRSLCEELNSCRLDATCIARCFVNNTSGFSVYTSYCTGYPRTMERLAALASNSDSAREFRERQVDLGHPLPLASYLLKPVQRILKYHLLLQNVVKQCASSDTEYALLKMTGIAQHIDDMKRKHEHAVRVQEIQSLLYGWNGPDLTTYGELCAEGTFRVFGAKAMRHVFLFDKMLLVTKNREDGILAYKSHIMCNNMMLVEAIAGAALSFHVIPWDAPRGQVTLQASSPRHKREWTLLLKRVILENYNVVIPSHARQIVMELGQNKTDDDMLAEKSHNLITQASIRKQLSAPEYLEKRKVDRERRKSLENGLRRRLKKPNRKQPIATSTNEQVPAPECDCIQVSIDKGIDYTCDVCYVDLCSDCETDPTNKDKNIKVNPKHDISSDKCSECDRTLEYIDAGSAEQLERRSCKCADFKSSQESFANLVKTRGYHSSDNISSYHEKTCDDGITGKNNVKTCLKCVKINENIVTEPLGSSFRKSRCLEPEKHKQQSNRSKSKEDTQRSKLSKIGTWRRKSEPGLPPNANIVKKLNNYGGNRSETRGNEKIEFECRNCGSNKITRRDRSGEVDADLESHRKRNGHQNNVDIKMYNSKTVPKKISKIKKIRAKGGRGPDTTAKFYAELSDVSDNILHISESNDSLNVDLIDATKSNEAISKDEDIDDETYKKLIEKTDSFKKNELEKVKYLNKQNVINEGSEVGDESVIVRHDEEALESGEETEQPLEQIISQLLLQNREFQKLLKKQQQRSSAHRRHQRLLKSHSNPEEPAPPPVPSNDKDQTSFRRQMSENLTHLPFELENELKETKNEKNIEEDHIYETLRPDSRVDESLHILNNKSKLINHNNHKLTRPKRLPSPPKTIKTTEAQNDGLRNKESDYVYLSFDKLNSIGDEHEGIYEVPMKSPEKVVERPKTQTDYYVMIDKQGPLILNSNKTSTEDAYDNIVELCKQKKEVVQTGSNDYLPMSPESPITPEIWLSRQKEHFNVSRDRKSGSLPRSFQVPGNAEENGVSTFKAKPSSNNKTYLNREGKVLSIDRPFTIASDQSEISYDDVENFMNESDILKFNKSIESDYSQNNSQSTLELEKEIDRCYKKNFESVNLNVSNDKDLLIVSQPNLNTSTASSCEVLSPDSNGNSKLPEIIHPQHKIYKPTSNLRSLRNVLTRFKTKTIKNNDDSESQEPSPKSDPKSPTNDKRSALNPRSYSKNLLQRFRSIIGDEQTDDNNLKPEKNEETGRKTDIKVIITQSESSPTTSSITTQDALSKSVYEQTTFTKNQTEENQIGHLSSSCDNISPKSTHKNRPPFEKSLSVASSTTSSVSVKSNSNSLHNLNKLPVYMQGSKHLGARIAQADYVDPTRLQNEKPDTKHVNVLINRISVRPDSLFSNSSFVTSSSEGLGQNGRKPEASETKSLKNTENSDNNKVKLQNHADESYYEKAFEKLITDDDVFRDSAVYSDQDDLEDNNKMATIKKISKTVTKQTEINKKEIKKVFITKVSESKSVTNTNITPSVLSQPNDKIKQELINKNKTRIAPPVPVKPKITNIPTTTALNARNINHKLVSQVSEIEQTESTNTVKRNANLKQSFLRSESAPDDRNKPKSADTSSTINKDQTDTKPSAVDDITNKGNTNNISAINNIHLKRLSFERASLDSATRKIKTLEIKNTNDTMKTTPKTVQERRMEIESLTKTQAKVSQLKKPTQIARPKAVPSKPLNDKKKSLPLNPSDKNNIPTENNITISNHEVSETDVEAKGSWVKTVVNKFQ